MKKLIALLLCLAMLASTFALAENFDETVLLDYAVTMDALPDGYTMDQFETENGIYLVVADDYEDDCMFFISVAPSEQFADFTMNDELTDEQMMEAMDALTDDYYDPSVEQMKTAYGTTVLVINENNAESDYADLLTIWHGYFVSVSLLKQGEVTDADIAMGMELMSNLWVVDAAPAEDAAPAGMMAGGWNVPADTNIPNDVLDTFYAAAGDDTQLQPKVLMGTQVVAGTNYAILCEDAEGYKIAYVYAKLDGTAELARVQMLLPLPEGLAGGWVEHTPESDSDEVAYEQVEAALSGVIGAKYDVDVILAEQVVAGMNYAVLCRVTPVTAAPSTHWALVTVYADLEGNASVTNVQDIELSLAE